MDKTDDKSLHEDDVNKFWSEIGVGLDSLSPKGQALRSKEELSPAQAAMETSLTVSEADEMLGELAEGGHLQVRVRGGGLFYSLWELDGDKPVSREIPEL